MPRLLLWVPVVIILLSAGFLALILSYYRDKTIVEDQYLAGSLARLTEEHTTRTLQSLERTLEAIENRLAQVALDSEPARINAALRERLKGRPYIRSVRVAGRNGMVRFSSDDEDNVDLSMRPYFKVFRGLSEQGFELAPPVLGTAPAGERSWYIPAIRPWRDAEGKVIGIIVAKIEPWYFAHAWTLEGDNRNTVTALVRADGVSLARAPFDVAAMGRSLASMPLFIEKLPKSPRGTYISAAFHGEAAIVAYRRMEAFPDYIVVLRKPLDLVLVEWREYSRIIVIGWAAASLVLAALCFWLSRAWRARQAEATRYMQLFEASPMSMAVIDRQTLRVLAVNEAAIRQYGWSRAEFLAMNAADIRAVPDARGVAALLAPGVLEARRTPIVTQHVRRDGSIVDAEVTARAIEFAGRPAVLALTNDVTERNRAELQLRQAQQMEAVGQMTGGIAQDFNNLLAVIIMEMESLTEDLASGTPWRDSADNALAAAIRGAEMVERLHAFSRGGELKPRRTEIGSLLQELRPLLMAAVPTINLEIDAAEGLYPCMVDRAGLETAILNLAVNARDAMPEQGRLRIVARNRVIASSSPELQAGMSPGAWLHIAIVDSGTGVSRNLSTRPDGSGGGLGLSMAYGLAIRSGGFVAVDSEPGGGTTIGLFLPPAPDVIAPSSGDLARGLAAAA